MNIKHPSKRCVPLSEGLAWGNVGLVQKKLDGSFDTYDLDGSMLAGERMTYGQFITFDCVQFNGEDVRLYPLQDRLRMRDHLAAAWGIPIVPETVGNGGEFLKRILDAGGEGAVIKSPGSYYDVMTACKRLQMFLCRVTEAAVGKQSVVIADAGTGQPRGRIRLGGGKCERVRVGSIIKIEGLELTSNGMIRDGRPCQDSENSFLVKY